MSVCFQVSDGQFDPISGHVTLSIIPLTLKAGKSSPVTVLQGSTLAYVTAENLGVETNGIR